MEIEDALKLASDLLIQKGLRPLSDVETLVLQGRAFRAKFLIKLSIC